MADVTSPFGFPDPEDTDLVRDGAYDIENLAEGVNEYRTGGYLYAGTRYYTSSGTFAKADAFGDTSNVVPRAIRVRLVGAGGGGGGGATTTAGQVSLATGGGGGAYAESFITDIASLDASVTVTRGGGGAGGTGASGSAGGASSFGSLVSANGGTSGGFRAAGTAPLGITGRSAQETATGDLVISGSGTEGYIGNTTYNFAPAGGRSHLAAGAPGRGLVAGITAGGAGVAGSNGGGGGGGAAAANGESAFTGGAGGNGLVAVDVFI